MSYKTLKKWLIWERKQEKKMGCLLPRATNMAEIQEVEEVPSILLPCAVCGRTFRPEALSKHTNVCERQHAKKRKKFDSAKQRIQGTELAEFLGPPPVPNKPRPKPPSPKKAQSRWKEKHEALVRTIRDEQTKPLDHEQCPHCDRYFGPKAFDRHVAWCKEQHSKIQAQNDNKDKSIAKQRLDARTKYRAPSIKSQRSVTKEKYSPHRPSAGNLTTSVSSVSSSGAQSAFPSLPRSNSISHSTSETGAFGGEGLRKLPASKTSRRNSLNRTSKKDEPTKSHHESIPPLKNSRIGLQSSQPSEARSISTPSFHTSGSGDIMSTSLHQDTKPTIKPSLSTNRDLERYDPFVSAELQMLELLKNEEDKVPDVSANPKHHSSKDIGQSDKSTRDKSSSRRSSVQSDFDKKGSSNVNSRRASTQSNSDKKGFSDSDKRVKQNKDNSDRRASIDSNKRSSIDRGSNVQYTEIKDSALIGDNRVSSPSSPFRSSPSSAFTPIHSSSPDIKPNNNNDIIDINSNTQPCKMLSLSTLSLCSESSLEALDPNLKQRCMSAAAASHPNRITTSRLSKQRLNMQDLLFGLDPKSNDSLNNNKRLEIEKCEAQLLNSMVEFELLLNRSPDSSPTHAPNLITDSAYSSLNRRWSPSGDQNSGGVQNDDPALSKFCHECGGRYPVAGAKFCCLCGVRRLAI